MNSKQIVLSSVLFLFPIITFSQIWTQVGTDIDGENDGDAFGSEVKLSPDGTTLAIGGLYNDGIVGVNSGHVRVFRFKNGTWNQLGQDIEGMFNNDLFGSSISLSDNGNTIAVGATRNSFGSTSSGQVRIFNWLDTAWVQKGTDIYGENSFDYSGNVALSSDGNIVAIGAHGNDDTADDSGHARIYNWNDSAWVQLGQDIDGKSFGDMFGLNLDLSSDGTIVAIAGPSNEGESLFEGHVRIFKWDGGSWIQLGTDIYGESEYDYSGASVSLNDDGTIVSIGSYENKDSGVKSGHVRVFYWNSSEWVQKGEDIDGEAAGDYSGVSNSLSSDGNTLAIGAMKNDGTGPDAGHVRIFNWNGLSWVQVGPDIDGEFKGDNSGSAVSLNSNGTVVAIGASLNGMYGALPGHVRVYQLDAQANLKTELHKNVSVYPNPSNDIVNISLETLNDVLVEVYTESGHLVYQMANINSATHQFQFKGPSGIYFLKVSNGENEFNFKLIKE